MHDIRDFYAPVGLEMHYPNLNAATGPSAPSSKDLPPTNQ